MHRPSFLIPLVTLATAAVLLAGCSGDQPDPEAPLPVISDARAAEIAVQPEEFCERIDTRAVAVAVGDDSTEAHYGNGDRAEMAPGLTDVAHEFGCVFTSATGEQARAWVVVPPVTADQAADFRPGGGCETAQPGLGSPGFAATCTTDAAVTLSLAGLYTDVWFGCSLELPADAVASTPAAQERLETWCAAAVLAAAS